MTLKGGYNLWKKLRLSYSDSIHKKKVIFFRVYNIHLKSAATHDIAMCFNLTNYSDMLIQQYWSHGFSIGQIRNVKNIFDSNDIVQFRCMCWLW